MVKSNGKEPTTLIFNDFILGLGEAELCFRLVHFWEARNSSRGGMLISVELLMTNEQHLKEEMGLGYLAQKIISVDPLSPASRNSRMRGFIDWVFHLPNLMASSSILLLGSDPFSRDNEEQNNQCMIFSLSFLIPFVRLLND
ncbi:hypothetical protein IGI04_002403 [Brassica rapa subsp. trilocularis]|uniref:Uncharacterized protein n=1 Tax=Brassica rapa subsp. trilocularis TaxID=1813537 RepID=A0ABQ7NW96_BRACM|nr:hypothetical protein IGI04_002403 [Brassica rapa subsp. trilocularis]